MLDYIVMQMRKLTVKRAIQRDAQCLLGEHGLLHKVRVSTASVLGKLVFNSLILIDRIQI